MYEHLKNDLMLELAKNFNSQQLNTIMLSLDKVALNYEVSEKCTQLVVYEDTFPYLAKLYLNSRFLEGMSPNSEILYRGRLKIFFETVQKSPQDVTAQDIRYFLVMYKKQRQISDRTLDKFRQIINAFYTWCVNEEYLTKNPCYNIKEIKYEVKPREALTRMELECLRRNCNDERELAIIDTLYSTGCRISELARMKISDINGEDKSTHIIGKGKKHNTCFFNINAQLSLQDYLNTRNDNSEYLFVSYRYPNNGLSVNMLEKIVKSIGIRAGLKVTPHIMRHTYATLAYENGMPLPELQKSLGHASSDTTLIYAKISETSVKQAHLKYVI